MSFVLSILTKNKLYIFLVIVLEVIQAAIFLLVPYFSKLQIDQLESQHQDFFDMISGSTLSIFLIIIILLALVQFLKQCLNIVRSFVTARLTYKLSEETEGKLFNLLLDFDAGFLDNPRNQRIISSIYDISNITGNSLEFVSKQLRICVTIFGILPIIALIDWRIFVFVAFFSFLEYLILRRKMKFENRLRLAEDRIDQRFFELKHWLIMGLQKLLLSGGANTVLSDYIRKRQEQLELRIKREKINGIYTFLSFLSSEVISIGVAVFAGIKVLAGATSLGSFTMITLYAGQVQASFSDVFSIHKEWHKLKLTLLRLGFFLRIKPRYDLSLAAPLTEHLSGDIVCSDLCFRYPNFSEEEKNYLTLLINSSEISLKKTDTWHWMEKELQVWRELLAEGEKETSLVLKDVSLRIPKGSITALVGRNGSGKTTLTNMIVRNFDPEQGSIVIGNRDLKTLHIKDTRSHIGIIQQNPFILDNYSLRENMTIGMPENDTPSDLEIWNILEQIELKSLVEKLPKKLESIIGDDFRPSGGQLQLLVIGRILLQKRPFIIFDEGTNQLDAEKERIIMDLLRKQAKESAVLMITHRMTSARKADYIYVIDDGRIVEEGTHQDLQNKNGLYAKFWNLQVVD